jgi:ATP-dependent 26S proteasome regulatory subunit
MDAIRCADLLRMYCGAWCREHAPSIIFMDEVDSIGSARTDNSGGGGDSEVQRTMLELLNQLDGFEATNKIKVGGWVGGRWVGGWVGGRRPERY